jgi:hypothetical protein
MASLEKIKQRFLTEQRLKTRLQRAASRVEAAEQERIWAIVTAHSEGLSIRKIAQETGLSSSRVHQLLHTEETRQIAQALNALLTTGKTIEEPSPNPEPSNLAAVQQQLFEEGEVLGWCIEWLEQLMRGEQVIVNLRPPSDSRTACVLFDQGRVIRVLKRIAGTLDELSGRRMTDESPDSGADRITAGAKHRKRLDEPEPQLSSLSQRAQREILREQLGLPPLYGS